MTNTEIIEKVRTHLLAQGHQARAAWPDGTIGCVYRASNGDMCAIGCLIPDEHYRPEFETVAADAVCDQLPPGMFGPGQVDLLLALQGMHDDAARFVGVGGESWDEYINRRCDQIAKGYAS